MPFIVMKYADEMQQYGKHGCGRATTANAYGAAEFGVDEEGNTIKMAYSCELAGVEPGKVFEDKESEEAKDYLSKLQAVNPSVGFGFVEVND